MDTNPPLVNQPYVPPPPPPGVLSTKIPSTVSFAVAILLFFMPFVNINCNGVKLQDVSGFQLATGFKTKSATDTNPFLNDVKPKELDQNITKATTQTDENKPNLFAMVSLGIGLIGLLLALTSSKATLGLGALLGIAGAGALIGLMIDIKNKAKIPIPNMGDKDSGGGGFQQGIENFGRNMSNKINISVDFTPWFYIAVIAFLAAAFFCFSRMRTVK